MSAAEIRLRLREKLRRRSERRWQTRGSQIAQTPVVTDKWAFTGQTVQLLPGTRKDELRNLAQQHSRVERNVRQIAERNASQACADVWNMLGHSFDVTGEIDWNQDPRSEFHWERSFYADVPIHNLPGEVDVKYVWELGRQQYVVELARGWVFSANEDYAQRAQGIVVDWIQQNPLYEGVHWTSALEVAMRAISWIWTLATLNGWDGWQEDAVVEIAESLVQHATYLEHHLEFYSSPYNHLIGEATALYLIGRVLENTSVGRRWKQMGRNVLGEHGPKQFYADGFCVEQATGYHFYTLGFLLMAVAAARQSGEPLTDLEPVVHKAALAGAAFRKPDGRWPAIGDVDSARSIPVHQDDFWRFDSLCNLAAVMFDDPELKTDPHNPGAEMYWLLGCEGIEHWNRLENASVTSQVVLEGSGYVIAKNEHNWLLFDAGPVAGGLFPDSTPSTAHGHADTLQVLYFAGDRPLLHDGGMPLYNGKTDWVQHFRSPAAHNTVAIEGCEYVHPVGRLAWSHEVERPTIEAEFSDEAWLARGRVEWPGVVLERHVFCLPGAGLWIADWIRTDGEREAHWFWQVPHAENSRINATESGSISVTLDDFDFTMTSSGRRIDGWIQNSDPARPDGWRCPGYGQREPGSRVVVKEVHSGETLVMTAMGACTQKVAVEAGNQRIGDEPDGNGSSIEYQSGAVRWTVVNIAGRQQRFEERPHPTVTHE